MTTVVVGGGGGEERIWDRGKDFERADCSLIIRATELVSILFLSQAQCSYTRLMSIIDSLYIVLYINYVN